MPTEQPHEPEELTEFVDLPAERYDAETDKERGIIAWFVRNQVAANLLMLGIAVAGLLVLPSIRAEVFPEISPNVVTVQITYPGAAPEEVEDGIVRRIEEAVRGLPGIKKITATAAESAGAVTIEGLDSADMQKLLADIKNRVDAIRTFPEDAERAIIGQIEMRRQVLNVALSGDAANERSLKELGKRIRDDITALPSVTQVELGNVRPYEISIEVSEPALQRYGLTFSQVASAVRRSSLDLPGGSVKTGGGEVLLRVMGQAYIDRDFERLPLLTRPDGTRITIGDVATVVDGFADVDQAARFDGERSVLIQVFRVGDQSALAIAKEVKQYVEEKRASLPAGLHMTTWRDDTLILESRIDLLARNAMTGLLLVFVVLALFLRFKLAFWVAVGIPVAFLGSLALMPVFDVSINMISLFAFIVVLGIVVDDAIVTGENIFKHLGKGHPGMGAAILGSKEVAVPVTFAVLTTVAAFAPMLNVAGNASEIWKQIPLVVIPCLLFSLVETKLVLPAHLSHQKPFGHDRDAGPARGLRRIPAALGRVWSTIQWPFTVGLDRMIHHVYRPVLNIALKWRYATISLGIATLGLTLSLAVAGFVKFSFFPSVEGDNVVATLEMPLGISVDQTRAAVERLEREALRLARELEEESGENLVEHLLASIGEQPFKTEQAQNAGHRAAAFSGSHLGEVNVQLIPSEERTLSSNEFLVRWRERVGNLADAVRLEFSSTLLSAAKDIDIQISAADLDQLQGAAHRLKKHLATYKGVEDIGDDYRQGKREVQLRLKEAAQPLGLQLEDLARQVRGAFYGAEAQRVQRGRDEVKVMVRYPEDQRGTLLALEEMRIRTPSGEEVPFNIVAKAEYGRGYAAIKRTEMARTINITAEIDEDNGGNGNEVIAKVKEEFLPKLQAEFPGLRVDFEGDAREQAETLESLGRGFLLALLAIYALMAIPFRSYLQPLIVMTAIPFGLVGAIWGHVILGFQLSIMSMLGLVALTGVVVNDSIVLVDFVNRYRAMGRSVFEAAHQAGLQRFRPILLTTLTTVAGLTPLLLERSVQARFLIPMGVSLAFGVLFSTFITLMLVPALYLVLEDLSRAVAWLLGREFRSVHRTKTPQPTAN